MFATTAVPTSPLTYRLPAKNSSWRAYQKEAIRGVLRSFERGVDLAGLMMPTGTGKSVVAMSLAQHFIQHYERPDGEAVKVGILVSTKALQDQYKEDFGALVTDIRGMGNYACRALEAKEFPAEVQARFWPDKRFTPTCDQAPCLIGVECGRRQYMAVKSCDYFDAVGHARNASIVVSNYMYMLMTEWMQFDLLIMDESHSLVGQLDQVAKIEHPNLPSTLDGAKAWAQRKLDDLTGEQSIEGVRTRAKMQRLLAMHPAENWVYIPGDDYRNPAWAPIKLTTEAAQLAGAAKKIVMMSATLRKSDVEGLVLASGRDFTWNFTEYPSPFPAARRPLVHISTTPPMKVGFNMPVGERMRLFKLMEEIVAHRTGELGERGIVHSASYQWAADFLKYTRHKDRAYFPRRSKEVGETVRAFKEREGGAVLISPSVTTGLDFPMDACRYQIILKVPFPSRADPVLVEREKIDKKYGQKIALGTLAQALGRGVRSKEDECFTFVLDENLKWVLFSDKDASQWVRDAYQQVASYGEWRRRRGQ